MKKLNFIISALVIALLASCQNNNTKHSDDEIRDTQKTESNLDSIDNSTALINQSNEDDDSNLFLKQAAINGKKELESSKIAIANASSAEVKKFAQMMIKDHEYLSNEINHLPIVEMF